MKNNKKNEKQNPLKDVSLFGDLKKLVNKENTSEKIPSIIEFVEDKKYLGLPHLNPPLKLFPLQNIVLKCFYRGSPGNENLQLTKEEIDFINKNNMNDPENGSMLDKWNSNERFTELVLVWGRRCLSEDCYILEPGTGKIKTLRELWNCGETNVTSWTYDEINQKMITIDNCNLIYQGYRDTYIIKTSSGCDIEATENHPMLSDNGWVSVRDLKPKQKLAICSYQPFFGFSKEIDENQAAVLGYLSSNLFDSAGNYIISKETNEDVYNDFNNKTDLCGYNLTLNDQTNQEIGVSNLYVSIFTQKESQDESKNIVNFLEQNGLKNKSCLQKSVPFRIFSSPKNVVISYLRSLLSSNGKLHFSKKDKFYSKLECVFNNIDLAKNCQHLLFRFGIFSIIQSSNFKNEHILIINKNNYVKMFINEIGFIGDNEAVREIDENVHETSVSEVVFTQIESIIKIGKKRTFDLQVSDEASLQNFVSNNFICHNSGKDFLVSIMALYEAMRLLEAPGGNPYKLYKLGSATPFTILTIANSSGQALILFREIKDKVLKSEYFKDKVLPEGIMSDSIFFLTPEDKKNNEKLIKEGFSPTPGSIVVRSGHSNSDSLVGISCFALLLDEIGLYKNTGGSSSGDAIFNSLAPAVKTYVKETPKIDEQGNLVYDEDGNQVFDKVYDGKVMCLSTPRSKDGIFYQLYSTHEESPHRLVCRAATWQVNLMHSKESLMAGSKSMNPERFDMEFGAKFSGTSGESFFSRDDVESCFADKSLKFIDYGDPSGIYFAHLDPAISSHNYALVVVHKEVFVNKELGKRDFKIFVDHIRYWSPSASSPISVEEVDEYIIRLSNRFRLGLVTYDIFNSKSSVMKLRKSGIPCKTTHYSKRYKNIIYDNLYQLVVQKKLYIPGHLLLKNEMFNLQRKWFDSGGYRVYPKRDGDVTTDDIVDALAGACYNCIDKDINSSVKGRLVSLPVIGSDLNNIVWKSMQGTPYGVGPGGRVSKMMENRYQRPL